MTAASRDPYSVQLLTEAFALLAADQFGPAAEAAHRVLVEVRARGRRDQGLEAAARVVAGASWARQGALEGLDALQRGVELLEADGQLREAARCCAVYVQTAWFAGRLDLMVAAVDRSGRLARAAGDHDHVAALDGLAVGHHYHAGRWDQAIRTAGVVLGHTSPTATLCSGVGGSGPRSGWPAATSTVPTPTPTPPWPWPATLLTTLWTPSWHTPCTAGCALPVVTSSGRLDA